MKIDKKELPIPFFIILLDDLGFGFNYLLMKNLKYDQGKCCSFSFYSFEKIMNWYLRFSPKQNSLA